MKAAVLTEFKHIEWKDVPEPEFGDTEVLIKVSYASICGSDQHVYNGEFGPRVTLPVIQGHEFVGTVADMGREVRGYKEGDRVAVDPIVWCGECPACQIQHYPACTSLRLIGIDMDGGFAEYAAADASMLYPVAPVVSDRDAALTEPYSIGFHASKRAEIKKGDTLAFYGGGKIGQHIMQAARTITDNTLFLVDIVDKRLELAKSAYPDIITINALRENPVDVISVHGESVSAHENHGGSIIDQRFHVVFIFSMNHLHSGNPYCTVVYGTVFREYNHFVLHAVRDR